MTRLAGLGLLALAALVAAACGGGGDAPEPVVIERLDFSGVDLSVEEYVDPPFTDQYPDVVAKVNGEEVTSRILASGQVLLEMSRRGLLDESYEVFPEGYVAALLADVESTDPLEAAVEELLLQQAAERLGLLPSYEEAQEFARSQQAGFYEEDSSPEERAELEQSRLGRRVSSDDWGLDPEVVEIYRRSGGVGELRSSQCDPAPTVEQIGISVTNRDCAAFLEEERSRAEIVYFVRWAE